MAGGGRDDEAWGAALRDPGQAGDQARRELRAGLVRGLARAVGGRAHAHVEDFAQEAMIRILARLDDYRGDSRFTTWALTVALRVAWSELRRARWQDVPIESLAPSEEAAAALAAAPDDPERSLARERAVDVLQAAIAELTERQRTVLVAEMRGMPQDEIGRRLGSSRNAVYKVCHDARRALVRALVRGGVTPEEVRWMFDAQGTGS
jgi:RNA polymerase sigma-70 factor (ECF subfamily)